MLLKNTHVFFQDPGYRAVFTTKRTSKYKIFVCICVYVCMYFNSKFITWKKNIQA